MDEFRTPRIDKTERMMCIGGSNDGRVYDVEPVENHIIKLPTLIPASMPLKDIGKTILTVEEHEQYKVQALYFGTEPRIYFLIPERADVYDSVLRVFQAYVKATKS